MKTLHHIANTLIRFFKRTNSKAETNNANTNQFEFTNPNIGIHLNPSSNLVKAPKSLWSEMYSKDNEILFI
jgi:hypothetical protein